MNNLSFTEQQYAALELSKEAAKELIEFSKYQLLSLLKSDLSYAEIVSQLLPWHNITKKATASTRRWALLIALSDLKKTEIFTQEELAPYIQKRKSQWWKKSVQNLYHVHGTIPLSDQEKELLVELQLSNPFLKWSQLDLDAIQKFCLEKTHHSRTKDYLSKILRSKMDKKVILTYTDDEKKKIIELYYEYFSKKIWKRLPAWTYPAITKTINEQYKNNRTPAAIESFINSYIKSNFHESL